MPPATGRLDAGAGTPAVIVAPGVSAVPPGEALVPAGGADSITLTVPPMAGTEGADADPAAIGVVASTAATGADAAGTGYSAEAVVLVVDAVSRLQPAQRERAAAASRRCDEADMNDLSKS